MRRPAACGRSWGTMTGHDLNSAIAFPFLPFRDGKVDLDAHARNVAYLVRNCFLDGGRRRVIANGGSTLLHHLTPEEQMEVARVTAEAVGDRAWFISGILPTPPAQAAWLVCRQAKLARPPDAFLILPVTGVCNPEGVGRDLRQFCDRLGGEFGVDFLLYMRDSALREVYCRLVRESKHIIGIKIGTSVDDVGPVCEAVGESGAVIWGKGDVSTEAVRAGARGHTSGTALMCVRAADEINNAQRRGDYAAAERIESDLRGLEEIRFMKGRAYNYSAMVEILRMSGFTDVDPGDGGPFNAAPPEEIVDRLRGLVERLRPYHGAA